MKLTKIIEAHCIFPVNGRSSWTKLRRTSWIKSSWFAPLAEYGANSEFCVGIMGNTENYTELSDFFPLDSDEWELFTYRQKRYGWEVFLFPNLIQKVWTIEDKPPDGYEGKKLNRMHIWDYEV